MALMFGVLLAVGVALFILLRKKFSLWPRLGLSAAAALAVAILWLGVGLLLPEQGSFEEIVLDDCQLSQVDGIYIYLKAADGSREHRFMDKAENEQLMATISDLQLRSLFGNQGYRKSGSDLMLVIVGRKPIPIEGGTRYQDVYIDIGFFTDAEGQIVLRIDSNNEKKKRLHIVYQVDADEGMALRDYLINGDNYDWY